MDEQNLMNRIPLTDLAVEIEALVREAEIHASEKFVQCAKERIYHVRRIVTAWF